MEEFLPSKQVVAGSSPVIHSIRLEISSLGGKPVALSRDIKLMAYIVGTLDLQKN